MYYFGKSLNYLASLYKGKKSAHPDEPTPQKARVQDIAFLAVIFLAIFATALEPKAL